MIPHFNPAILEDPDLQALLSHIPEAYFVGGMVRNFCLKKPIQDIDLTSALSPEAIQTRFKDTPIKTLPTGIEHGTITLVYKNLMIEHTTFRQDIETDGRHAKVSFTKDITQDAQRRDFTINALYADQQGRIIDPTGQGFKDLKTESVCFIGNAEERITEDALRILRFFRFSLYYAHGKFDEDGLIACKTLSARLKQLSQERITEEMFKILNHPDYIKVIRTMASIGILSFLIQNPDILHIEPSTLLEACPQKHLIRLAGLNKAFDVIDLAFPLFRFSKKEAQFLHFLISPPIIPSTDYALHTYGRDKTFGLMLLGKLAMDKEKIKYWTIKKFPLTGDDLLNIGFSSNKILGKVLKETEAWWIEKHFTPSKADCLTHIKSHFL